MKNFKRPAWYDYTDIGAYSKGSDLLARRRWMSSDGNLYPTVTDHGIQFYTWQERMKFEAKMMAQGR